MVTQNTVFLTSERLCLRRVRDEDFDLLLRMRTHPEINHFTDWPRPGVDAIEWVKTLLADMQMKQPGDEGWFQYILTSHNDAFIGDIGVNFGGPGPRQVEVGYRIAPEHQGRGYTIEALAVLIPHLIDRHAIHRFTALIAVKNKTSVGVVTRLGFRREGYFRKSFLKDGRWLDDSFFALLAEEWAWPRPD